MFVIEADEYDTAFFDKGAKFLHYRPRTLVINNLEFDHADIYQDLAAIQRQFHQLVQNGAGQRADHLPRRRRRTSRDVLDRGCWTPVQTFASRPGRAGGLDGHRRRRTVSTLLSRGQPQGAAAWQLAGDHNAENVTAAVLAARNVGVGIATSLDAVASFSGVKRRLELLGSWGGVRLYDDFAHHPDGDHAHARRRPRDAASRNGCWWSPSRARTR